VTLGTTRSRSPGRAHRYLVHDPILGARTVTAIRTTTNTVIKTIKIGTCRLRSRSEPSGANEHGDALLPDRAGWLGQSAGVPGSWPLLAQPWAGGITGWLVVFGACVFEIVAGIVTNPAPALVATVVLAFPAVVAIGFTVVQFRQARLCGADPTSWWHLAGVAAAVFTWLVWPTSPGVLYGVASARRACIVLLGKPRPTADCLARAAQAMDARNVAWWLAGALIVMIALLTRRSRMAAWAAIAAALAGCLIATHFLEMLLLHYHHGA
jgi:hypothetical protein